jgi:hypothetical protein
MARNKEKTNRKLHFDGTVVSFSATKLTWQFVAFFPIVSLYDDIHLIVTVKGLIFATVFLLHEHPSLSESNANGHDDGTLIARVEWALIKKIHEWLLFHYQTLCPTRNALIFSRLKVLFQKNSTSLLCNNYLSWKLFLWLHTTDLDKQGL